MKKLYVILAISFLSVTGASAYEGDIARVDNAAPAFDAIATDGAVVSIPAPDGKVVLLVFFATWCEACSAEMQYIEQEIRQVFNADGLVVIAVGRGHSNNELAMYKASRGIGFRIVADPDRAIYRQYATKKIPRCYVIGKDGAIKFESVGFSEDNNSKLEKAIALELNK